MTNEELLQIIEQAARDKVTELDLSDKDLTTLPEEIVQLTNLQTLDLRNNQLSSLPVEIVQLTNLQTLHLSSNQLSSLPAETEPFYEAKFLIIGEGGAGKTSLAKKIANETYKLQPEEKSTEGIEVIQWHFTQPNGQDFRVNIWDFGGQEIYHQTHQFFLSKRSLYVLVADTRKENTDIYWWLKVVELLSDKSPVLIIKNEKQNRDCQVNERQLRGEFSNLKEILATNLDTNRGLTEIKNAIQLYISNLDHVGTPLPKLWVRVRAALENDSRNYISFEEYSTICRLNKLTDRKDMLRLSNYLHDLGVCLHFQDEYSKLKHCVILKPEWGTTAVYKVLDNDKVKKNLGCFTKDDLKDIWQDDEYADMRAELLELMMQFKLCYEIPGHRDTYIAPQLLSIEKADYSWDESNNLILRYTYTFMPKGMLTRFIVEMHSLIEQQTLVWKTGVVLVKDQTRAEVIENYNQREIKIRVAGNRKKELMATVTHELEKIHKSYEHLQYQTLVPCNCENCKDIQMPHFYDRDVLYRSLDACNSQIQCQKSFRMVDVRRLIDDVLLTSPNRQILMSELVTRNKVFISYSHKDQKWFDDLKIHLEPLIREQNLKVWDDTQIEPGAVWRDEIQAALATAKVAVLLVSPNFLASSFISQNELPPLLEAAKAEGVKILWIPLRASNYKVTPIEQYQATHASDRPLNNIAAGRRDQAWVDICEIIKAAAVS